MTRLDKCEHEIRHVRLLHKFKMADYLESLAVKSSNGDDIAFMEIVKEFPCIYITEVAPNLKIKI